MGDPGSIPGLGRSPGEGERLPTPLFLGFPCNSAGKESACNAGDPGLIPGLGSSPREGKSLPTPVFWPGEFCGLYSPWGLKESDTTDRLSLLGFELHHSPYSLFFLNMCWYFQGTQPEASAFQKPYFFFCRQSFPLSHLPLPHDYKQQQLPSPSQLLPSFASFPLNCKLLKNI